MEKISNGNGFIKTIEYHLGRTVLNNLKKLKDGIHQVELLSDDLNTHEEVRLRSVRVARGLQTRGLGVGDVIVICGNTHNHMCLPVLAAFYIGSTVFPLSTAMTIDEAKIMLEQGPPKIIFCDPCMERIFTRALQELNLHVEIVIFGDVHRDSDTTHITPFSEFLKPTGTEDSFEVTDFDPTATLAVIICSSGSTGHPKSVCLTHSSLAIRIHLITTSEYRYNGSWLLMSFTNYFWMSGTVYLLYTCISGTPRINSAMPYTVELLEKGLAMYKPETLYLCPATLYDLVKDELFEKLDFSSLKIFLVGGCPISENIITTMKTKLKNGKVYHVYASTEAGNICVNKEGKTASMGKPLPWIDWKVINIKTGEKVKPGEYGELRVKADTLFKCYFNDPKTTKEAFDENGYYKTGDLVYSDEEEFLYFVERTKEVILFRNYEVAPTEIESEIRKLPGVLQVCVVRKKHKEDGEHPVAFVQKRKGSNLTEQDIKDFVQNALADHKQLRGGVIFMDKIPETGSGKMNRMYLKEVASQSVLFGLFNSKPLKSCE